MTTKRTRKHFRTLDAKTDAIVFDGGKRRLWNTAKLGQLILAQTLKLSQRGDGHDLKDQFVGEDTVGHAITGGPHRRSPSSQRRTDSSD
jgi:hypothetical protein